MKAPIRRALHLTAVASLAATLSACGNAQVPVSSSGHQAAATGGSSAARPSNAPASATPSASTSAVTSNAASASTPDRSAAPAVGDTESQTVDGHQIAGLPKGFPFPDTAKVDLVVAGSMVQLSAPDAAEIAAFYRAELPKAGLPIDFDSGGDSAVLLFENEHWQGQVSVNSDAGALITWGPPLEDPDSPSATGSAAGDTPETRVDVGLTNVDLFLHFPAGTELADIVDTESRAEFTFTKPEPAAVLAFYRELSTSTVHFTRESDQSADGVTTLKWHSDDYDMTLVADDASARMTAEPR